jgi:hypothetical protein
MTAHLEIHNEVVFETHKLESNEYIEVQCDSNLANDILDVLRAKLSNDYCASYGYPQGEGSIIKIERRQT